MELLMRQTGQPMPKVKRVLEVNAEHPVIKNLEQIFKKDGSAPVIGEYANLLYGQAVLAEGGKLEDPSDFAQRVVALMQTRD